MGPLSVDLRKRVVTAIREEGMSCRAAARQFKVSYASAIRWAQAMRGRGSFAPLAMGGEPLRCSVPHGHYKAITFVCGLRLRGVVAPKAYDHAMNAETFETWLVEHLLPSLEEGDIVVLDNLQAHRTRECRKSWRKRDARVRYLPPYSPDFNPIEKAFSKLKAFLRRLVERTVAGLIAALEGCAGLCKSEECANYFEACRYDPTEALTLDTT